jgi:hypothetical protein
MENDTFRELIAIYKENGYVGTLAVEKAEAELKRRTHELELRQQLAAGK